jgi:hypothetical protein
VSSELFSRVPSIISKSADSSGCHRYKFLSVLIDNLLSPSFFGKEFIGFLSHVKNSE